MRMAVIRIIGKSKTSLKYSTKSPEIMDMNTPIGCKYTMSDDD